MRRFVLVGVVVLIAAVSAYVHFSLKDLRRNVEIKIGGYKRIVISDEIVVYDWRNLLLCGVVTTGDGKDVKRFRFDSVEGVDPHLTAVDSKVICDMDLPWWWIKV